MLQVHGNLFQTPEKVGGVLVMIFAKQLNVRIKL